VKRQYLTVEEVAELLRCSRRSVHGLTAARALPHRKLAGTRRLLFVEDEVRAFVEAGTTLETIELKDGGRLVRPIGKPS
jgi:excisionase family DNA binding protein